MKQTLIISCPASSRSGYGDHSRDIIRSLIEMDRFDIKILDQRWGDCPRNALAKDDIINTMMLPNPNQLPYKPDVWIQITVPNEFQAIGNYNIGITAGMETDQISGPWIDGCNRMNKIIVPSVHSKDVILNTILEERRGEQVLRKLQVEKPVEVLFEGLNIDVFDKKDVKFDGLKEVKETFCFLCVGHWLNGTFGNDRKDIGGVIRTFLETFKGSALNKPALILKTSSAGFSVMDREEMLKRIEQIKDSVNSANLPNVYLLHGDLTEEEMNQLYNDPKVKAMVSFTHGEGFGRPLLEFGITGKPVVAPNWSGHIDFLSENGILLPTQLREVDKSAVWKDVIVEGSKWAYIDYGYASATLKELFKKYKDFLTKSRKQRKYIKDNFTMKHMTELFKSMIEESVPKKVELKLPKLKLPKLEKVTNE